MIHPSASELCPRAVDLFEYSFGKFAAFHARGVPAELWESPAALSVDWLGAFLRLFRDRTQRPDVANRQRFPARLDQSAGLPSREQPADGEQRRAGHLRQLFA